MQVNSIGSVNDILAVWDSLKTVKKNDQTQFKIRNLIINYLQRQSGFDEQERKTLDELKIKVENDGDISFRNWIERSIQRRSLKRPRSEEEVSLLEKLPPEILGKLPLDRSSRNALHKVNHYFRNMVENPLYLTSGLNSGTFDRMSIKAHLKLLKRCGHSMESLDFRKVIYGYDSFQVAYLKMVADLCPHLTKLCFEHKRMGPQMIETIATLPQLRELELVGSKLNKPGQQSLTRLSDLTSLVAINTFQDTAIQSVGKLTNLQKLTLAHTNLTSHDMAQIENLTNLNELNLWRSWGLTDASVSRLSALTNLQRLDLTRTNVSNKSMASLASLPMLRKLDLSYTKVDKEGIAFFNPIRPKKLLQAIPPIYS